MYEYFFPNIQACNNCKNCNAPILLGLLLDFIFSQKEKTNYKFCRNSAKKAFFICSLTHIYISTEVHVVDD